MIDFLKPLLDAVTKLIPDIVERKEKNKETELGAELYLIYIQFNESLLTEEKIVHSLETYVQRMRNHLETGRDGYALTAGRWVSANVDLQLQNLVGIRNRIDRWRRQLQILD